MQSLPHPPATLDPRWPTLISRERAADGQFYYSVRSTGIYCRPSCASRLPNPANVRFHATPAEAEGAGFRACKRCTPNGSGPDLAVAAKVTAACRSIESAEASPSLTTLARAAGLSPQHFQRVFKAATGLTPKGYATAHRRREVERQLTRADTVTEAIYAAGYNASSRFYEKSAEWLGMHPTQYRDGGVGAVIRFAIGECSLGSILVAASARGLCAILLGDDADALARDLQDRFHKAELVGADAEFEAWVAAVVGFVKAPAKGLALPLDLRGTIFQQRVWRALQAIPPGATASYAEIAARLGAPRSSRAVARACAASPLAVAIPCHRVVRSDGALSGYRWGVERKRELLAREAT